MHGEPYRTGPIRFAYAAAPCLDLADLTIRRGEVTVIAGENGSGKTTLLKILAGLLVPEPVDGAAGIGAGTLDGIRHDSVYLHQVPYLFRGTVYRNLSLARGTPRTESRRAEVRRAALPSASLRELCEQALDSVGLGGFGERRARELSGGQGKRVALARIFLSNKPVLLLDEPAAHADDQSVTLIESACRSFAQAGRTVVVATHRGGFGYRVADHLLDLAGGRLQAAAVNILKGEVVRRDAGFLHFKSGDVGFRVPAQDGAFRVAVVGGHDIILSRHPLESSARNCLEGTLLGLERRSDGTLAARIDCGVVISSVITNAAAADLTLEPGIRVYATFKASSVRLY